MRHLSFLVRLHFLVFDAAPRTDQHRHQMNFRVDLSGSTQVKTVADFGWATVSEPRP
jgi:hypothetical protein